MTKIAYISDLHFDTWVPDHQRVAVAVAQEVKCHTPEVLLIAGDIAIHTEVYRDALRILKESAEHVLVVPGNHCVRVHPEEARWIRDSAHKHDEILPQVCREEGVHPLWVEPWEKGGVYYVGTYGHYDYSFCPPALVTEEYRQTKRFGDIQFEDHFYIHWPPYVRQSSGGGWYTDDPAVASHLLERFRAQLRARPLAARRCVALVHTVPFAQGVSFRGDPEWDICSAGMGSQWIGSAMSEASVDLAVFGHTHFHQHFNASGVDCRNVAFGRPKPGEWPEGMSVEERARRCVGVAEL